MSSIYGQATFGLSTYGSPQPASYFRTVMGESPVFYARLDDAASAVAADVSSTHRSGKYVGVVTPTAGALNGDFNQAALFDGATGFVTFGDAPPLSFLDNKFTFEFWAKITGGTTGILSKRAQSNYEYAIYATGDSVLHFQAFSPSGVTIIHLTCAYTPNIWTYWVWTSDGANSFVYKDGAADCAGALALGPTVPTPNAPTVVATTNPTYPAVILAQSGILEYLRLGESSGTTAFDASSGGRNATITASGVTLAQAGAIVGDADTAFAFSGTAGQSLVPSGSALPSVTDFTIEAWVKLTTGADGHALGNNYLYGGSTAAFGANHTVRLVARDAGVSHTPGYFGVWIGGIEYAIQGHSSQIASLMNAYHHFVGTRKGKVLSLYVDGVLMDQRSDLPSLPCDDIRGVWANSDVGSEPLIGVLDEAVLYSSALSAADILYHFQVGSGSGFLATGTYKTEVTYTDPTGETTPSGLVTSVIGARGGFLTVSSPIVLGDASGWYIYVTQPNGSTFTRQQPAGLPTPLNTNLVVSSVSGGGASPPVSNTTAMPPNTSMGDTTAPFDIGRAGPLQNVLYYLNGSLDEVAAYSYPLNALQIATHFSARTRIPTVSGTRIATYLPSGDIHGASSFFQNLWASEGEEFDAATAAINGLSNQLFAPTATWALDQWESDFSLPNGAGVLTTAQRQARLVAQISGLLQMPTQQTLTNMANAYQFGNASFIEDFSTYALYVRFQGTSGIPPNIAILQGQVSAALPAHLTVTFQYQYLLWNNLDRCNFTWNQMDANSWTWAVLEVQPGCQ